MAVNCSGIIDVVSSSFRWNISNFSEKCNNTGNFITGDFIKSPTFTAMGISKDVEWHLRLYPNGQVVCFKDFWSLYVYTNRSVKLTIHLKLVDAEGKVVLSRCVNKVSSYGRGFTKFVSREFVMNPENNIFNEDTMTIICEITDSLYKATEVTGKATKRKYEVLDADVPHHIQVIKNYETLFSNSKFSDVTLIAGDKSFKVHKCILANSSEVFAAMFAADMKEKRENTVKIDDIKYDVLLQVLRYIYMGSVDNLDTLGGELALAADKYALRGLKKLCEMSMLDNLSTDSALTYLQAADKLFMKKLKNKAIEFIVDNAKIVTEKPEFEALPSNLVSKVCRRLAKREYVVL